MRPNMSVIVPAWNAEKTIGALLRSLADEVGGTNTEVIVADNGSTDRTVEVAKSMMRLFRQFRVVDASSRTGPAAARNAGLRAASADWIAFLDADDVVLPGWGCASLRAAGHFVHAAGAMIKFRDGEDLPFDKPAPTVPLGFYGVRAYAGGGVFYADRSHLLDIGGFPEDYRTAEDLAASWRLQIRGHDLGYIPEARVAVRLRAGYRADFRRYFEYGYSDPKVFAEFRTSGMTRPSISALIHTYLGLVARLPLLWEPNVRRKWVTQLGRRAGRLLGSIRYQTWYP